MRSLVILFSTLALAIPSSGQDIVFAASDIAKSLTLEMSEQDNKSIAVSSFRDISGQITPVGEFFAEELYTQLVSVKRAGMIIVERSRTDAVFGEQRLGIDGLREPGKLDDFVNILKVDALIVGTVTKIPELGDKMRINARLIATPSGQAIASASAYVPVPKDLPEATTKRAPNLEPITTYELKGVVYELMGCAKETRLITCHLILTNNGSDRYVTVYVDFSGIGRSFLYDQRGYYFNSNRITIADVDSSSQEAKKYLITEIPTAMKMFFSGVPSAVDFIKILHIETDDGDFEFRNIQFSE